MNLSIIIPVYNTAEFISQCLNSVIQQVDESCMEIIVINDGSTDGSLTICENYSKKYNFIKLINQENMGLAMARNRGLDEACGEFILFLDSDDYYFEMQGNNENSYLKTLIKLAREKSADVVCINYSRKESRQPERLIKGEVITDIKVLVNQNVYTSSACLKMIKKKVIFDNNIKFIENTLSEDILFSAKLLEVVNINIIFLNQVVYFYRVRAGSITKSVCKKQILDILDTINLLKNSESEILLSYLGFQYATLMINLGNLKELMEKEILQEIYALSYLLKYNSSFVVKTVKLSNRILGNRLTIKLLKTAFNLKEHLR